MIRVRFDIFCEVPLYVLILWQPTLDIIDIHAEDLHLDSEFDAQHNVIE